MVSDTRGKNTQHNGYTVSKLLEELSYVCTNNHLSNLEEKRYWQSNFGGKTKGVFVEY